MAPHFVGVWVFDRLVNLKCRLGAGDGPGAVAEFVEGQTRVKECVAFAPAVADLAGDGQLLLVELDGAARLAQVRVGQAEAAQRAAFAPAVADLAGDGQVLLDRKSTRLNSSHIQKSRMPSSA